MSEIASVEAARKSPHSIAPSGIEAYPDCIRMWLPEPLQQEQLRWLKSECGHVKCRNGHKRWDRDRLYQQSIQLGQPSHEALQSLSTVEGVQMNYLELALDWMFDDEYQRDDAFEFVCNHLVKRWHGKQAVKFCKKTRYTGQRKVANKLVSYADQPSRTTGELYCVHNEWRCNGDPSVTSGLYRFRAGLIEVKSSAVLAGTADHENRQPA